jgi:hypothetical protein
MPMGRRTAARRDVHINKAEASSSVAGGQKNRVGVAHQADVWPAFIIGTGHDQTSL